MAEANEQLLEIYRANVKATLDVIQASLQSAEALRRQQLMAIQDAKTESLEWMRRFESAKTVEELVSLQEQLSRAQFENVAGYWSDLFHTTAQAEIDAVRRMHEQTARLAEEFLRILDQAPDAGDPVMAAFKSLLGTAFSAYAQAAKAVEGVARLAQDAAGSADAGLRPAADSPRKSA